MDKVEPLVIVAWLMFKGWRLEYDPIPGGRIFPQISNNRVAVNSWQEALEHQMLQEMEDAERGRSFND